MESKSIILKSAERVYSTPIIETIQLDNEISLILSSTEPLPPGPGCAPENKENFEESPF